MSIHDYSSSSETESMSSSSSHPGSLMSSDDKSSADFDAFDSICPYDKEPEWTEEELIAQSHGLAEEECGEDVAQEPSMDVWPPESRTGNTDWCQCGECVARERRQDCVCCKEYAECLTKLCEGDSSYCITAHKDFDVVCTNRAVLCTALTGFLDMTKRRPGEPADNRYGRFALSVVVARTCASR